MKCWKCDRDVSDLDAAGLCPDCATKAARDRAYWQAQLDNLSTTLTPWNGRGWTWQYADEEWRTNNHGDGLFRRRTDFTWMQVAGTGQFSLPKHRGQALFSLRAYYTRLLKK